MTIKSFLYRAVFLLLLFTQVGCNRDFEADIINSTPPSLEVIVKNAAGQLLANTTVKLFNTEASWNAETGEIASANTSAQGIVLFTEQQMPEPGFYFILATDGTKKVKLKTKYLLRTDGKTRVNLVL